MNRIYWFAAILGISLIIPYVYEAFGRGPCEPSDYIILLTLAPLVSCLTIWIGAGSHSSRVGVFVATAIFGAWIALLFLAKDWLLEEYSLPADGGFICAEQRDMRFDSLDLR